MILRFKGGNELLELDIDRKSKRLNIRSSLTNYQKHEVEWWRLFDKGKEKHQDELTEKLNDTEFKFTVVASLAQQGYILTEKVN